MNRIFPICLLSVLMGCGGSGGENPAPAANQAPTLDAVASVRVDANGTAKTSVRIADDRTAADDLRVEAIPDNETLFPKGSVSIASTGAERSISLTPMIDEVGSSTVKVTALDAEQLSAAAQFTVVVEPLTRNAATFSRDLADINELDEPAFINAVEFVDDADNDDFADLLPE